MNDARPMPNTILIIDDDLTFASVLSRSLNRRGYTTLSAQDGETALTLAARDNPPRVILDLNLNGVSGLSLIPALLSGNPERRIVVLTGYGSIATAVDAVIKGATQYLAKPVDIEAILAAFDDEERPETPPAPEEPFSIDRLEWEHIQRVLQENAGNVSATARALKMHRRTLQRKLTKHPVRE